MAESIVKGKLVLQPTRGGAVRRVVFPTKRGISEPHPFDQHELDPALARRPDAEIDGLEVELELSGGKPRRIRPPGQEWAVKSPVRAAVGGAPAVAARAPARTAAPTSLGRFHNPYSFIPAPPRRVEHPELGDHPPLGHERHEHAGLGGRLQVELTTVTPLLLPDAANLREDRQGHKTYPVRLGADGKPYLPPTSVKGMLRAAYEAVTNSRMSVFQSHRDRLAYRMEAQDGLRMVPVRIEAEGGGLAVRLLPGTSRIGPGGKPRPSEPMYAAWLPRYQRGPAMPAKLPSGSLPAHDAEVEVWLERYEKPGRFQYWRVVKAVPAGTPLGPQPPVGRPTRGHQPAAGIAMVQARGHVCITNQNIDRKHDERVFFVDPRHPQGASLRVVLSPEEQKAVEAGFRELIRNYQEIHETELAKGRSGPPALTGSVWSRHVVGGEAETILAPGTLCYARVEDRQGAFHIVALYPVMIARELYARSPEDLLDSSLRPAMAMEELSPADRVFGWVKQDGHGAYRGQLRVGPVRCETEDAVEAFPEEGVPLAILGQPKPQQARFYVAATPSGEAQQDGLSREKAGYAPGKGLRGRKVYPHHAGLQEGYWANPQEDRTQHPVEGRFQEYRRPRSADGERDDQNRSVLGWIRPGVRFVFDLDIINLSPVELGALLWLLRMPEGHHHRIGGGKPLGFGSVRLHVLHCDVRTGEEWRNAYRGLDLAGTAAPSEELIGECIERFEAQMIQAYGEQGLESVVPLMAFLRAAQGPADEKPIHYPRLEGSQPSPPPTEGLGYEWFVANDKNDGPRKALPDLFVPRARR